MHTRVDVAKAWADGLARMKLPETLIIENGGKTASTFENLLRLMTIEKARALNKADDQQPRK